MRRVRGLRAAAVAPLPLDTPQRIQVGDATVEVTLIDAGHCPGACMFLFEAGERSWLHTGHLRATEATLRHPALAPFVQRRRSLSALHVDNYSADFRQLPTVQEAAEEVTELAAGLVSRG